jgi:hypothetical protein
MPFLYSIVYIMSLEGHLFRWAEHGAGMEKKRNANKVMVGKPKRKTPLESSWRRWEYNRSSINTYRMGKNEFR